MGYNNPATFNGVSFNILNLDNSQVQGTKKQKVGSTLVETPILGRTEQDLILNITFELATNISTQDTTRTNLRSADDGDKHAYVDGVNDGDYIIRTGSLKFVETEGRSSLLEGSMTLVQYQQ